MAAELEKGIETLRGQAKRDYLMSYYQGFGVTTAPAWYGAGVGPSAPSGAPKEATAVQQLQTLNTIADLLRDALKGVSPATLGS